MDRNRGDSIMKVYGNLINRIEEHTKNPVPEVGMGATIYLWSDRLPGTITKVSPSGKTIEITEDEVTTWENHYGKEFAANPNGRTFTARLKPNGTWRTLKSSNGVSLGNRAAYRDPSF